MSSPPPLPAKRTPFEQAVVTLTEGIWELNETVRKHTLVVARDTAARELAAAGPPRDKLASVEDVRAATTSDATGLRVQRWVQRRVGAWVINLAVATLAGALVHYLHLAHILTAGK